MKFCVIPPNAHSELAHKGTMYFALAHLYIKSPEYRNFYKQAKADGHFVILDNGAAESSLVTQDILMECVKDLMPNEVIAPDVLFDKDKTIENCELFIERMNSEGLLDSVNIFFCPQGETKEDWLAAYTYAIHNEFISTIGLSKIAVPYAFNQVKGDQLIKESRHECVDYLIETGLLRKPIHCLGAGDPREFAYYKDMPLLRSTDSCFSIWSAMCGIDWHGGMFTRIKTPHDYFDARLNPNHLALAEKNIQFLAENCVFDVKPSNLV